MDREASELCCRFGLNSSWGKGGSLGIQEKFKYYKRKLDFLGNEKQRRHVLESQPQLLFLSEPNIPRVRSMGQDENESTAPKCNVDQILFKMGTQ